MNRDEAIIAISRLAAYEDLVNACRRGNPRFPEFLRWVAARLVEVHGDGENVDFVQALKRYANDIEKAMIRL